MEETTVDIIGIIIAAIIMLIVPLILIADRSDDISQLAVQTATAEFIDDVIKTGQITNNRYNQFIDSLASSGNTYEIDMEVKILDKNTAKNGGSNTYYSIYTSQIEERLNGSLAKFVLKQGDEISVTVKNSNKTFSQVLKSFYYNSAGEHVSIILATASGTVAIDGKTSGT